jgi:hypothetical protein
MERFMPRLPKPKPLRQNTERRDYGLVPLDGGLGSIPTPPRGLLVVTRDDWDAFWRSPLAATALPDTDGPSIRRLFVLRDQAERISRAVRSKPVVPGSMGQSRANPLYQTLTALLAEIRQLEDRFGLSPMARLRLGVQLGDAARSLADLNAELHADPDATTTADLLLTLADPDVADPRARGDRVDGAQPRPRARRRAG